MLNQTIKAAESYPTPELIDDYTSDIALLKTLRDNYDAALRAMAHLNCGMKETENTPYEYTSPSILMQTLHEGCYEYINKNDLFGYAFSKYLKREDAIKAYSSLEIDKNISWSTFLENLLVSGTPFFQ